MAYVIENCVYFIRDRQSCAIKIGWCKKDPMQRLYVLQTGNVHRLEPLIAISNATQQTERLLHNMFAMHNITGEWFNSKVIEDYIKYKIGFEELIIPPESPFETSGDWHTKFTEFELS